MPLDTVALEAREASLDSGGLGQRFRLAFSVIGVVLVLSLVKAAIHWLGVEFLSLNSLFTSAIGGAIFIIGFLMSSILSDYKEAERLPAEIRLSLEGIHDDIEAFSSTQESYDIAGLRKLLANIVRTLIKGLSSRENHGDIEPVLKHVDHLSAVFADLDRREMPPNYVTRLRGLQDALRRSLFRIYHIQTQQFVPSIHILVYSLVASVIFLLLFLKTEGSPESALMFGFVSYMFVYALYLIGMLEKPFRKGHDTLDDVSLFLLRAYDEKLEALIGREAAPPSRPVVEKRSKARDSQRRA